MTDKKSNSPNIRINKVYTRFGDEGKTRLIGGVECYKDDVRVEAYGTVDELRDDGALVQFMSQEMMVQLMRQETIVLLMR